MTMVGAAFITRVTGDVSIMSGSDFTGNTADDTGGMYGCDKDW